MQIPIPAEPIEKQMWFDALYAKVDTLKALQAQMQTELDALLPSVLDRAFRENRPTLICDPRHL